MPQPRTTAIVVAMMTSCNRESSIERIRSFHSCAKQAKRQAMIDSSPPSLRFSENHMEIISPALQASSIDCSAPGQKNRPETRQSVCLVQVQHAVHARKIKIQTMLQDKKIRFTLPGVQDNQRVISLRDARMAAEPLRAQVRPLALAPAPPRVHHPQREPPPHPQASCPSRQPRDCDNGSCRYRQG